MANIIRCDDCKKLNDEQGVGYIGKNWMIKDTPRSAIMKIKTTRDCCRECVKKLFNDNSLTTDNEDF